MGSLRRFPLLIVVLCAGLLACQSGRRSSRGGSSGPGPDDSTDAGTAGMDAQPPASDGDASADGRDGGAEEDDAGRTAADSGSPDAGAGRTDAGMMPRDAGHDAGPPDTPVHDIQTGRVGVDTTVRVEGVVVTARYSAGIYVQEPAGGARHSGIRVYLEETPTVTIGDLVDVEGTVIEYFGETELESATLTRRGRGTPIVPTPVTVAEAMEEAYEGVLVRLTNGEYFPVPYDCSMDDPACADEGLWSIIGSSPVDGVIAYDLVYEGSDWSAHEGDLPVRGVMGWRYERRRIMPRTAADFGP